MSAVALRNTDASNALDETYYVTVRIAGQLVGLTVRYVEDVLAQCRSLQSC